MCGAIEASKAKRLRAFEDETGKAKKPVAEWMLTYRR
jgi:hypothetical protein